MIEQYYTVDDCNTIKEVEKYVDDGDYCPQDLINLWKENKLLKSELQKETIRKESAYKREINLEEDNRSLRREKFKVFNEEEYYIFQEDEDNYLRSLTCPVVLSPVYLQELLELLWTHNMYLDFVLEQDACIWEDAQEEDAKVAVKGANILLKNFERSNNKGTN